MTLHFALYLVTASLIHAAGRLIELSWFCQCPVCVWEMNCTLTLTNI